MARKGILMSDPTVREMNEVQWQFEYHALLEHEKRTYSFIRNAFEAFFTRLQNLVVRVLGLNIIQSWRAAGVDTSKKEVAEALKDETPFVPYAYLAVDAERIQHFANLDDGKTDAEREAEDAQIKAFNEALRSGKLEDQIPAYREPYKLTDTLEFREQYKARFGIEFPADLLAEKKRAAAAAAKTETASSSDEAVAAPEAAPTPAPKVVGKPMGGV